jgi:ATP-dependent RNA helicase HelY
MFDPVTADFVRSAAPLPGLDPASLVDELTAAYVDIAASRLSIGTEDQHANLAQVVDKMSRLADAYEAEIVLNVQAERRRAIAFVAGSARQVLVQVSRVVSEAEEPTKLSDRVVGAELSASLLFLIAQRSSDAYEASRGHSSGG